MLLLGVMLALAASLIPQLNAHSVLFSAYYFALLGGALVILGAIWLSSTQREDPGFLAGSFLGLLVVELSFNFLAPSFYLFNSLVSAGANPYEGAPYVKFLGERNRDHERIFAREGLLYPNWAGAFELQDVRDLDGHVLLPLHRLHPQPVAEARRRSPERRHGRPIHGCGCRVSLQLRHGA